MSNSTHIFEESIEGYATTGPDGILKGSLNDRINLGAASITGRLIGSGEYQATPLFAGNPKIYPTPEGKVSVWPCRLFKLIVPVGAVGLKLDRGAWQVSAAAVREEDSLQCLGPQEDELMTMAEQLLAITPEQQQRLTDLTEQNDSRQKVRQVREHAIEEGRDNSPAIMNLMWISRVWARHPIGNAALAVAHRDLLLRSAELTGCYEQLYRPWHEVMGAAGSTH